MPEPLLSPQALLDAAHASGAVTTAQGDRIGIHSQISPAFAQALSSFVAREQPRVVVEIGMAHGFSTLAILQSLPADGMLFSIDPFQDSEYAGVGSVQVARSTRAAAHRLIAELDYLALPRMIEEGLQVDFAYVDGMHTFDHVLLDAFYLDKLVRVGGTIAFNDCGFRSIHKFLKFWKTHRRYAEVDVGLPGDFRGANPIFTLVRRLTGRSNQDRYFRKLADFAPAHNFFVDF